MSFFYQAFSALPEGNTRYRSGYIPTRVGPEKQFSVHFRSFVNVISCEIQTEV
jgi:hypothetical protein